MTKEIRYFRLPVSLREEQKANPVTKDLYLTETGEIEVEPGGSWRSLTKLSNNLLVFCTRGGGSVVLGEEQVPVSHDQYFIVPRGEVFKFCSRQKSGTRLLVAGFNGKKARQLESEFLVVRNLVPSVNNMVANREMLFDEIFNNLSKGFHDQNLEYVNFCFGHLLATFIYANRTSEDLADELNPVIHRAIRFLEKNLDKKLTLLQIAREAGYSPTYFTTLFRKETNYAPLSYFSHLKILKACELLDYTEKKVKEISFNVGYSDPYYFTRDFKKKIGLSPRQYRNRIKG
ncbi:transcriptional regulator, AraC family [Mariniphaga anaerophila]|uniref:Transcriptional regulator, AraC family n=1 Tax=Mariniphaga anaerophila TaxID=1484053 RepID=A0A1M5CCG9_9BACT|nr:AraC family transcriptional regulator [Mariniphaga anaerophila]SHF52438.1 transcriptional regulator, AraC family [Mariniphaga anaerophila]